MSCPNSTADGCKCPQHYAGLAAHAADPVAYAQALAACKPEREPVRLSIVTPGPSNEPACDSTMTCPCPTCVQQRQTLASARGQIHQPWVPRPSRTRRKTIARNEARRAA